MNQAHNPSDADSGRPSPALHTIVVGDTTTAWSNAGFTLTGANGDEVVLGPIRIRLIGGDRRGVVAWEFAGLEDDGSIDGLLSLVRDEPVPVDVEHPNNVSVVDHVVLMSPDVDRTVTALRVTGFEPKRRRVLDTATPPRQQVFFWAGPTILELVGPLEAESTGPSTIWGVALVSDDLMASKRQLGDLLSDPKEAVQRGRQIATVRTRDLDISITIALMSAHERAA